MINTLSVPLKWETPRAKESLPLIKPFPYRIHERAQLAKTMSFDRLFGLNDVQVNQEYQRQCRWKSLRQLFYITSLSSYKNHSLETALYTLPGLVTNEHFVMAIMAEYAFPRSLRMDAHLKWLYWSYDLNKTNQVDWRDILAGYRLLASFRLIRERNMELFLLMADIYCEGNDPNSKAIKDDFLLPSPCKVLAKVALTPCQSDAEVESMQSMVEDMCKVIAKRGFSQVMKRRSLQGLLQEVGGDLLSRWAALCWDRLSSDQRLTILDESQLYHKDQAEIIIARHKLSQALLMYQRNVSKLIFKEWRSITIRATGARVFNFRKDTQKKRTAMRFWLYYAHRRAIRRKRRVLADVMGAYALKARCFLRIKLFNENIRKIVRAVGSLHKNRRQFELAGTHLRQYFRLHALRVHYHRWWDICVTMNNMEVSTYANRCRLLKRCIRPWFALAHAAALAERQDMIARENKITFDRKIADTEAAFAELLALEKARDERKAAELKAWEDQEKQRKLEEYKTKVKMEKYTEKKCILAQQREERSERIEKELKTMKKKFKKEWDGKEKEFILKAKERMAAYIENKENESALDMKFEALKRDFYAFPSPETKERERMHSSYRNILFLYIEAKIRYEGYSLEKLIADYDHLKKGFLTFAELTKYVRSINTCLNEAQITSAIRSTDRSKDKEVSLHELKDGIDRIQGHMGVVGSPWKIYIDPTEDVICYHNFETNEKVLEYTMTDKLLRRIVIDDLYGMAQEQALKDMVVQKAEAWQALMRDYMIRRLQFMYRYWKGMTYRKKKAWKIAKRIQREITRNQRICVKYLEKTFIARDARKLFHKQLQLTIERIYDVDTGAEFYYNHITQQSSWEKPWLLVRYGQVSAPSVWVPMDSQQVYQPAAESVNTNEDGRGYDERALLPVEDANGQIIDYDAPQAAIRQAPIKPTNLSSSYWHVQARRAIPFKPDGFLLCDRCHHQVAVHTCTQCNVLKMEDGRTLGGHFCFPCHRASHANPMGFMQRSKATKKQYSSPEFIERYSNFKHTWTETVPYHCDMCKQTKLNAAFMCQTCKNKKMCRTCFHRVHQHDPGHKHHYYHI